MVTPLDPNDLERLERLVERLERAADRLDAADATAAASSLVTAQEIAQRFGVSAAWVRARADELGAIRLGTGPKARLRFLPPQVEQALIARQTSEQSPQPDTPAPTGRPARRRHQQSTSGAQLLPIRGARA